MPHIYAETGVMIRFLAAMRRIPLTIVKDAVTPADYLKKNLEVLRAVAVDPYVAGCDFVGEEITDIITIKPVFKEVVKIAAEDPTFVIRVHAGENDSTKDNISHSIECIRDNLAPGQPMPRVRLGHGLYTYSLRSAKGKKVLQDLKENNIVLEFQITSNVRLNNLNSIEGHPLRSYLAKGINCVQGTDGAALYGTNSMDEQLSLRNFLELSDEEMMLMRKTEDRIISEGREAYSAKKDKLLRLMNSRTLEEFFFERMEESQGIKNLALRHVRKYDAVTELKDRIEEIPWDLKPVILMGGSFNTEKRVTTLTDEGIAQLNALCEYLDPSEVCFVVGHKLSGYEKYLIDHNDKKFRIFAVVPSLITRAESRKLRDAGVFIRVSPESEGTGIYKSIHYEIFERRPSVVVAFDGNSTGANIIQEARNGKGKALILVSTRSKVLREKANSLGGYVLFFDKDHPVTEQIKKASGGIK